MKTGHHSARMEAGTVHIDEYQYGRIVIDGRVERRDVTLSSSGLHPNWWRSDGHALSLEDLETVLEDSPRVLVVGTGTSGNMQPVPGLAAVLADRGIEMEAMPTHEAVRRFNELIGLDDVEVAAAFHLTC